jgi:hypothetical protein
MSEPKKQPIFFPTQSVDNFFDKPEEIVQFANSLEYKTAQSGFWPGKRTEELHINHTLFFKSFLTRLFALFFDYSHTKLRWSDVGMYFQKTSAFDPKDKSNILNTGLIHQDGNFPLVGLVYLTKDACKDSGTSIMLPNKKYKHRPELADEKVRLHKIPQEKQTKKDLEDRKKLILSLNENFEESIRFNNKFNRLIAYTGTDFHKCNSFYSGQDERLTLVFFVGKMKSNSQTPLQRLNNQLIQGK